MSRQITIAGGGLAGLALGIALREREVAVTLHEASDYPRHRVCGEFLSGVSDEVLENLGISFALEDAVPLRSSCWYDEEGPLRDMEVRGRGISRHLLDDRLQKRFRELGGILITGSRLEAEIVSGREGMVWAAGRPRRASEWVGLKCHVRDLPLTHDLEMHVGRAGYVGLARIEEGRVNVCGLFRKREASGAKGVQLLHHYLAELGLPDLSVRLAKAVVDAPSFCGVAGISFAAAATRNLSIGDAAAVIPPFAGNGMSMALEAAFNAISPVLDYAEGRIPWSEAIVRNRKLASITFGRRLRVANLLHPVISHPRGARWVRGLGMARFLPFGFLYRTLR
jgi:2-polyprenyl-6-methoxyphenol hydroxylase-like FAD-dependent oxidoreductase